MVPHRLAFAALGLACVAAAAGGSYLATRHNVAERAMPPALATSAPTALVGAAVAPGAPVVNSESMSSAPVPPIAAARPLPASRPTEPLRQAARPSARSLPASTARIEPGTPALERTPASVAPSPVVVDPPTIARMDERAAEPVREVEPPAPTFDELTVAADSVIGLQTETTLTSERARVEDRVEARVVRDVRAGGRVAIPAGSRVLGSVVLVERGGKMRDRARLGIRFHTLALGDGTRVPITTETIYRFGEGASDNSAKKIGGGAVAGAILGAIIGGGKGAAIGATTGAAGGSAAVMAGERSEAVFQSGAQITARILAPISVTVDR